MSFSYVLSICPCAMSFPQFLFTNPSPMSFPNALTLSAIQLPYPILHPTTRLTPLCLSLTTFQAVNAVGPVAAQGKPPFLFWLKTPAHDCCLQLIERSPMLQAQCKAYMPHLRHPVQYMAKKFAKCIRTTANQVPPSHWNYDRVAFPSPHLAAAGAVIARWIDRIIYGAPHPTPCSPPPPCGHYAHRTWSADFLHSTPGGGTRNEEISNCFCCCAKS